MFLHSAFIKLIVITSLSSSEKINLDTLNNYSQFLNFGTKINKLKESLENDIFKNKVDVLGEVFKKSVDLLKNNQKLDIVFLVDSSSSVGETNFKSELKFVKKLLSDITVDYDHTRVALITFSDRSNIVIEVDEITKPSRDQNKCLFLNKQLTNITYKGGGTYTLGAFETAQEIFSKSRPDSKKAVFLITDGYSNGGDPVPTAQQLKNRQISIFTIGIQNGNYKELYNLSSSPGEFYSYLLDSFEEFEGLARRALHVDLKTGEYIPLGVSSPCDILCKEGNCCDENAVCTCGTTTGHYFCKCQPGYYGTGLKNNCLPCTSGTFSDGPNLCLPCPDIHHTTTPPAIGIESCQCKLGYKSTPFNQCEVLHCPKISIPEHGYLVKKKECSTVLNSACGVRCEVGYTLSGNSIRLCQANATWSGIEPSCEVKTCENLSAPRFGSISCYHSDLNKHYYNETSLPVDTVCTFKCDEGKALIGSSQRTCLPLSRWDGLRTTCKQIKCNKLPQIRFATLEPKSCGYGKQEFGKTCKIKCPDGFDLKGPSEKVCNGSHGSWNSKNYTLCIDVTPPILQCPHNITNKTLEGKKYGLAFWQTPKVVDNSALEVSIWMKPSIKSFKHFKFEIGSTSVTYFAQDVFQNQVNCTFYVNIIDKEIPTIENCISPPTFLSSQQEVNVTWDEPNFFDNSQNITVIKSHSFGLFPRGTTTVTYRVIDPSHNENVCKINITVEEPRCETLPDPVYGHSDCNKQENGLQCIITCDEGYAIPLTGHNPNISFVCQHSDPLWFNPDGLLFPECSVSKIPEISEQNATVEVNLPEDICKNPNKIIEVENEIGLAFQRGICSSNCSIEASSECNKEQTEEETNRIKRDVAHPKRHRKRLNIKLHVRGKHINNATNLTLPYNSSLIYTKASIICPSGSIPRKNRCVHCPKGTFHNVTVNKCQSCPFGFYSDQVGQTKCKECDINHSTRKLHSKSKSECREQCPPGTYARKKLVKYHKLNQNLTFERATLKPHCRSCNIATYQPKYGQLSCLSCPSGYTTLSYASTNIDQCIPLIEHVCGSKNICNNGTCKAKNIYEYYCECNNGYIGSNCERRISSCDSNPCLNKGTCHELPHGEFLCSCKKGYNGRLCQEEAQHCQKSCLNGGSCLETEQGEICLCPNGFQGEFCQQTYCNNYICENNSTCISENDTFKCVCTEGYLGRRCNILPCDYKPCKNKLCINVMKANASRESFRCVCPEGFQGLNCEEKIDYCKENPCLNNATCINEPPSRKCKCSKLFYGLNCEFKRDTRFILNFHKYDTNNYIRLKGFSEDLTEVTACVWTETLDTVNYGTFISYANREFYNAFTLTDYTGLVLYVNDQHIVTDILLNDGNWNHICILWASKKGFYQIFINGHEAKNGTGLATNMVIKSKGNMIIGQEQDSLGGSFSQSESFLGKLAYFDVWSKLLTFEEISKHLNECNEAFYGDLYAWPEILENLHGNIEVLPSNFCNKCREPSTLFNGLIEIANNVAYYSCSKGYQLSTDIYKAGRKCTKASKWEGNVEPICKKIYCGYPGFIQNSIQIGNSYYYEDSIRFECYEGYKIQGESRITCNETGKWYPGLPKCMGNQCPFKEKIKNINMTVISDSIYEADTELFDAGTQLEFNCLKGTLQGESLLTCNENGEWDYSFPTCLHRLLDCSLNLVPKPSKNGFITPESLSAISNGSNHVEYKCENGFKLIGENTSTCIIDGYWTEPKTSCEPVSCSKPIIMKNMIIKNKAAMQEKYFFGDKITFECIEGYKLFGLDTISCTSKGWSSSRAKCIRKTCGKPKVSFETTIEGTSYLYNDNITIICPNGMQYVLQCNKLGIWEGQKDPAC